MPELPEVETIVRGLRPRLLGCRIEHIETRQPRVAIGDLAPAAGYAIAGVRRRGKFILLELRRATAAAHLVVHLGMTGQLRFDCRPGPHTRVVIQLDRGLTLLYNDTRQFGRLEFCAALPARVERLGPDPLEISLREFGRSLRARRTQIKALLLNQAFLSGMGNIYADEALFRAKVHPRVISSSLQADKAARLHRAMVGVLEAAIGRGGSSVSNYVASDGRKGSFQLLHKVYRRTGQPCVVCGAKLRRILVASRGTHFCPRCQRAPRTG